MHIETVALIGAGGHAKVVFDALRTTKPMLGIQVWDENSDLKGRELLGSVVNAPIENLHDLPRMAHVAVGNNAARRRIGMECLHAGKELFSVLHHCACVSPCSLLGQGVFIAARAIVAPSSEVSLGAIINHAAIIDHDCHIGEWAHVAPNAVIGGGVHVGVGSLVGAGAVILPEVDIGEWVVIGAGAVVTASVSSGKTVYGVPARVRNTQ